jgi:hypothetical protein
MKVDIEFVCRNVVGMKIRNGIYDIPHDSTVRDLVGISAEESGAKLPSDFDNIAVYLVNGKHANAWDSLTDGDKVHVVQSIFGG